MREGKSNIYTKILKSTSLFGSVQLFALITSVIKSKFLAVLIGPAGYGFFSILNSNVEVIRQLSGFSIETSGVKSISEIKHDNNKTELNKRASALIKIAFLTGLLGITISIIFSEVLSLIAFNNDEKVWAIILVSGSIFFKQITSARSAVIQGLSKLSYLAKLNLYSNLFSLIFTLPLYFIWHIKAVVPAIILSSVISFIVSAFFYKKTGITNYKAGFKETFNNSKKTLYFGGLLSLSAFLPSLVNYTLQILINKTGGLDEVGIFTITTVVINSYVGIVFTAMSMEYYPRLASYNKDVYKESEAINAQAILSMLIIIPIIIFFLGFASFIIKIFFSSDFLRAVPVISWAIIGMFFKAVSFSMGYLIIARADSKVFTKTAIIFNALYFILCISGYHWFGLEGLGIGMAFYFFIHLTAIFFLIRIRYSIKLLPEFYYIFIVGLLFCTSSVLVHFFADGMLRIVISSVLLALSVIFSVREINKRVGLKDFFLKIFKNG